jgi:hypothetical protein
MVIRFIFLLLGFVYSLGGFSQINIQWESRLNGAGSFIDKAVDVELDASGNTYATGASYNGTSYDWVTVKYNSEGVELWRRSYGGSGIDEPHALVLDGANNVIVTGSRFISGTDWDIATIKINGTTGAIIWSVINPGSERFDYGVDVAVDPFNNVIVLGALSVATGNTDFVTIKYSSGGGGLTWSRTLGGAFNDNPKVILTDAASNVYVTGNHEFSIGTTYLDFRVAKYNSVGTLQWSVTEDSGFGKLDTPFAMALDASNNVIVTGSGFTDILNEEDFMTVKFSGAAGAMIWKRLYAGDAEALDVANAVVVGSSNNVYVTGKSKSIAAGEDYYTIAYNSSGTELWSSRYTTPGLRYDEAKDIRISADGLSLYVTGYSFYPATNNDFATLKYNATTGEILWTTIFNGPSSNSDQAVKMKLDAAQNIFITGNSHGGATNLDYSTIKYCQLTTDAPDDTSVCIGGSVVLTATGGTDITWSVLSGDAGSMSCTLCASMTATPDITTVYLVSSESLSGCVDYDTVQVTVNPLPTPEIYHDTPLSFCAGGSVVLYTDVYDSYVWSTGSVLNSTVVSSSSAVTLTIEDFDGCTGSTTETVVEYPLPIVNAGLDDAVCPGEGIVLNASGALTYLWDTHPTLSSLVIPNPTATPLVTTEYRVRGTDINGCQDRDSVIITRHAAPAVNAGPDESVCVGDSVHLLATGAISYIWEAEPSLSSLVIANPWASPTVLTEYFVTGTDINGCTKMDSVNVSTLSAPLINAGEDTSVCIGSEVQLFASGGLPGLYDWNADPTLSDLDVFNPFASPTIPASYIVEGTDINGCSNTDTVFVHVNSLPSVDAGDDDEICLGDSIQLEASGAISYVWDTDPTLSELDIADPWASPITTRTYTVTAEDGDGCANFDEVTITVNALPIISAGSDVTICEGDSTQLNALGGIIYVWGFDLTLSNFLIGNPWAQPLVTTTYVVEGTDVNGCANIDEVVVSILPGPAPPVLVKDGMYIISSVPIGNQWYLDADMLDGETNDSVNYIEIGLNGEYWVVYTNDDGCSVSSDRIDNQILITDVSVKENELPLLVKVYPNPATSIVFVEFDGQLDAILIYGMDGSLVYKPENIDTGITQMDLDFLPAGTYLLQLVKDDQVVIKKIIKR